VDVVTSTFPRLSNKNRSDRKLTEVAEPSNRLIIFSLLSFTFLFKYLEDLNHFFLKKGSETRLETTREIKDFIAFIEEKGLRWKSISCSVKIKLLMP
jgi:hypothetical protein